jgi:lactoylglutathione lyase
VDHLDAACERLESLKVNWKKRLTDGRMKNVAVSWTYRQAFLCLEPHGTVVQLLTCTLQFVLDPDGYWIEIVQNEAFTGKDNF